MSTGALEREITPRVNSTLLQKFVGRTVRLPCKLLKFNDDGSLTVSASDDGQVQVIMKGDHISISDTYLEVIGKVSDPTTIELLGCISLGKDLDMKLVNDTINLIHDDRFFNKLFSY